MTSLFQLADRTTGQVLRAVIYTRVSHDNGGRSCEEQEFECRRFCELMGWAVTKVISDNDRSASRFAAKERENYPTVLQMIANNEMDVVVLWESSRGQRDLGDFVYLRDLCAEKGVLYAYSGKVYDMNHTGDRFNTGIDALVAERYASETRDRVLRDVRGNAMRGRPHGRLLYGYTRRYGEDGKFIEQPIVEPEAAVLRWMADQVLVEGLTARTIALSLNEEGIFAPGGGDWNHTEVRRLLINPAYAGKRVHRGVVVGKAVWKEIFSEEMHAALVARLTDPARRTVRDPSVKNLLTGTALCGLCDEPVKMKLLRSGKEKSYSCSAKYHVTIKQTTLEEYVEAVVLERLSRPDAADLFRPATTVSKDVAQAQADLADYHAQLASCTDEVVGRRMTPAMAGQIEARLIPLIKAAERKIRPVVPVPALQKLLDAPDVPSVWEQLTMPARREVIKRIMVVRVLPTGRGRKPFDPERVDIMFRS